MYSHFTDDVRNVMRNADSLAKTHGQEYPGTLHILLSLIRGRHVVGRNVLKHLGVDMEELATDADEAIKGIGDDEAFQSPPRAKRVIECAIKQSSEMGHDYVGTEHIVLGILDDGDSAAAQLLKKRNLTLSATKEQVRRLLGS